MGLIRRMADTRRPDSFSSRRRAERFRVFEDLIADLPRPLTILDVGGTPRFWKFRGYTERDDIRIVVINLTKPRMHPGNVDILRASATNLPFTDGSFEVVFSNSVIEHLETAEAQRKMADEITRVGKRYFVQTPNRYFPMEPHFYFLFFQFLPLRTRVWLATHLPLGRKGRIKDRNEALDAVRSIRLMPPREMTDLFRGAILVRERFLGLTKSVVAVKGSRPVAMGRDT